MGKLNFKSRQTLSLAAFGVFVLLVGPAVASFGHDARVNVKSGGGASQEDMITLNFSEPTSLKNIIKTMAQVSGRKIILSQNIDAKVQVVSQHPLSKEAAYHAFISALDLAGLTVIDDGKAIRIIKKPSAG